MKIIEEREDGTRRVAISFPASEPESVSVTKQEFWKDASINHIMKKYRKTGILGDPLSYKIGEYGDFTSGNDFFDAMRKVTAVQTTFNELPSHIRSRFGNDPRNMMDFLVDPKNNEEAINMGLKEKGKPATNEPTNGTENPVVNPPVNPPIVS